MYSLATMYLKEPKSVTNTELRNSNEY